MVLSSNGGLLGDEPETRLKGSEGDGPASPRAVRKPAHEFVADLHIHSRYAYACSKNLTLDNIAATAKTKGIHLLATGDFTHPMWLDELQANLTPVDEGTFEFGGLRFVLGTEVSCVYKQGGKGRRLHLLLYVSSFEAVRRLNASLAARGSKLGGDGRPSVGMAAPDLASLVLDTDPRAMIVPAHIWTPWYGMLGSKSGFDGIEECFGDMAPQVRAVETGLSSDPSMNWAVPEVSKRTVVSFSDAHSAANLGREVTVFRHDSGLPSYLGLKEALEKGEVAYTVEFYPEEGKYHYDGHRNCGVSRSPQESLEQGGRCPVCGRAITLGVLNRVQSLSAEDLPQPLPGSDGFLRSGEGRPPFMRLVPLEELLSQALGAGRRTKTVQNFYLRLCDDLGDELSVLARASPGDLAAASNERVANAILRARSGQVSVVPGFDGQYGKVLVC